MKVEFYKHGVGDAELKAIAEVLRTPFLTTGETVNRFEQEFVRHIGAPHAVGVMSCTHALQLALLAEGIGPGDEVITTPLTFIATANVIELTGARTVFADVDARTGCIHPAEVSRRITDRTRAIICVHLYGHLCDMKSLRRIADARNLALIEDCAHAVESERDGVKSGQLGDYSAFSFYATKNLTSGEGGAVGVKTPKAAELLRQLRNHGMSRNAAQRYAGAYEHWDMDHLGMKCNMNNIQAAMLLTQLPGLQARLARREEICRRYEQAFKGVSGLAFPEVLPGAKSARHLFTIWVDRARRDNVLAGLQKREVGVAVNYRAVHLMKYYNERYKTRRGEHPHAEEICDRTITLPLYPTLTDAEIDYVIESVIASIK